MEKTGLFVDVQNIYYTVREALKGQFDYNSFWRRIAANECQMIVANAYAIDRQDEKQIQFQNILRGIGFAVKLKPYISRQDGSSKGDWDVGITIDMMEESPRLDRLILLSGDGDFDMLVEKLRSKDKIVDVYGVKKLSAESLIKSASSFRDIDQTYLMKR